MARENLKSRTINGMTWSLLDSFAGSGISFLIGILLARLLSPKEYGIMAMIAVFMAVSTAVVDSGFSNALIRKTDADDVDYSTSFYFNICVSFSIYIILFLAAPHISLFFSQPLLTSLARILGLGLIIDSFSSVQKTLFVKKVDFEKQTKISLVTAILSGCIGVILALNEFGIWSLVYMQITRQALSLLLYWVTSDWRPSWIFSLERFKNLFGFGSKILLSSLIETVYKNIYYIIIGRFYSSYALGQYTRAEQFSTIFSSNLTNAIQRVSYPVLSSIQDDAERLKEAYRKIIKSTMLVTFACMMTLAALSKPLLFILIGEKWSEAASYLQIICISEALYPLHALNLNMLQVKGRSSLILKLEIIKKMVAVVPIALGIFGGIKMMLVGSVFFSIAAFVINSYYSRKLLNYSTKDQVIDILPSLLVSCTVSMILVGVSFMKMNLYVTLSFQVIVGAILYIIIYEQLKLDEYRYIKELVLKSYGKRKFTINS
ncbi:MAG: lipopolysaccharide biosynthesis protein [Arcticibacter sp.]